ncbi:MAG: hypothetical protein ACHRHE_08600 [Tepidisphaerales bacterium]
MPHRPVQSPPPLPIAATPVGVTLDYATAPRIAGGIAWQRSGQRLHLGFEAPRPSPTNALAIAGGVMMLGLLLITALLFCSGVFSMSSYEEGSGLAMLIGVVALGTPAVGYSVFRVILRRRPVARPVELDATPAGLSLLVPERSPAPLVWPAERLREIRCTAVPGSFCIEVFPADTPPEEHWFDIDGELAPELLELELRQILRLGEAVVPADRAAPLNYATPVRPAEQREARIPWIRRSDYVLVLLPPPGSLPWHQMIMSLGLVGASVAFFYTLSFLLDHGAPAIPVTCLFVGATLAGLLVAVVSGRRSRTSPGERDRATLVMACPGRLWLHVRGTRTQPESFDAGRIKGLSVTASERGLWLHLKTDDGAAVDHFLPTRALAAGAALCDDLRRIMGTPDGRSV